MALAIPPLVVLARESGAAEALEALLGRPARPPGRGPARRRAATSASSPSWRTRNARFALDQDRRRHEQARGRRREALADLQAKLDLPAPPARIEAYDISNLGETYAVASMVVFEGGAPAKAHYRTFTMRDEAGRDDFARIREAVRRRFSRLAEPGEDDASFAARPGLVVIDGGKGQLSAALGGHARGGGRGRPGGEPRQAPRGGLPPGLARPAAAAGGLGGAARAAARPRRGPPLRAAPPPRPARARHDRERPRRPPGRGPGPQGGAAAPLRLDRALPRREPRGARGRPGRPGEGGARRLRPPPQDRGAARGRRGRRREREGAWS